MAENRHNANLLEILRRDIKRAVFLKHSDRFTVGVPDLSMTLFGMTSWWEAKHADPTFESTGIQELTMLRLSREGTAFYIIYDESDKKSPKTLIVEPQNFKELKPLTFCRGISYEFVRNFMYQLHQDYGAHPR